MHILHVHCNGIICTCSDCLFLSHAENGEKKEVDNKSTVREVAETIELASDGSGEWLRFATWRKETDWFDYVTLSFKYV